MKIDKPIFGVRVIRGNDISLNDALRIDLTHACESFLSKMKDDDYNNNLLEASEELAIDHRIAIRQYMTGLKVQEYANKIITTDTVVLEDEVNTFLKEFNKVTK
jgi:hypothetical protein